MQGGNVAAETMQGQYKRRTYLIDRRFQLKYVLILVVVGAAVSLLFGALMYQAHAEVTALMDLPRPAVTSRDNTMIWLVVGVGLVMAISLGALGVVITHRVAGPIFVLGKYLSLLGDGVYPTLRRLREKDELQEVFEQLYKSIEKMKERDQRDGDALHEAAEALEKLVYDHPDLRDSAAPHLNRIAEISGRKLRALGESGSIARLPSAQKIEAEEPL